jgi:chromosomal replication initiator protein
MNTNALFAGENSPNESKNAPQHDVQFAQHVWADCLNIIRPRVNSQSYNTWLEPVAPVGIINEKFVLRVPSQFFSDWLEEHYASLITDVLTKVIGSEVGLDYEVLPEERDSSPVEPGSPPSVTDSVSGHEQSQPAVEPSWQNRDSSRSRWGTAPYLVPRYTFQNYIKGESNQFACAAALAVANTPGGTSFNPLVIYGGVGLGKTHLVHAIGNQALKVDRGKRVLYVSSEKFTIDFVEAIQKDSVSDFSTFYRSVDLLIVDDIQFFVGKEKTQDTFFHTFNELYRLGKQIVLSCDRPPKELKGLHDRLISRFQSGLTADIQPPDLETRIAILRAKSSDNGVTLPDNVAEFIALNVTSNIRELEGCLISLTARASMESRRIDMELAKDVVRLIVGEVRTHLTIEEIQRVVCDHLGIPADLIRAKTRRQEVVNARQIAMYLTKELTNSSLKTIGLHFGGRDHSTVIHAYQTVEDSMSTDPKQKNLVLQLKSKLELSLG